MKKPHQPQLLQVLTKPVPLPSSKAPLTSSGQQLQLIQGPTKPAPLPSGWEYMRLLSPQVSRRVQPGTFNATSKKRGYAESNDDFRERANLA